MNKLRVILGETKMTVLLLKEWGGLLYLNLSNSIGLNYGLCNAYKYTSKL